MSELSPLDEPLDVLAPKSFWKRALPPIAVALLIPLSPLLLLLSPLLLLSAPVGLLLLGLRRPALLRGLPRDLAFVFRLISATRQLNGRLRRSAGHFTTADYWAETVAKFAHNHALVFDGVAYTYADVDAASDRVAAWAVAQGLKPGDAAALLCANRPEHLFCWLGLAKVGVTVTLVANQLRGASLQHALTQCHVKLVIFDAASASTLAPIAAKAADADANANANAVATADANAAANANAVADADADADADAKDGLRGLRFFCIDAEETPAFATALSLPSMAVPVDPAVRQTCLSTDTVLHIFTSGTTGMPKAARLNHIRFFSAIVIPYMFGLKEGERLYCCLPMCHTAAIGGLSVCWWLGGTMILSPKFSASKFWKEVAENKATVIQYIGEICRYLVHSPPSEYDRKHSVRLAFGNGLRPEVWSRFKERFGIEQIGEVYASTEGNANLANTEGREGAVGFISPLLAPLYPVKLVRLAADGSGELMRDGKGRCVQCGPGEVGELLGLVNQRDASRNFAGYTDRTATRKRLARSVVKPGDAWFRTGDLLKADEEGYVYFVDRSGDTFRFKGENVSTAEVSAVIGACPGVRHCVVYGVQLPSVDGRVGMAALLPAEGEAPPSWDTLYSALEAQLPPYAHPRFVRLLPEGEDIEQTHTFKVKKDKLQAEGCDPNTVELVFIRDAPRRTFVPLSAAAYKDVVMGSVPLN